MPIFWSYSAANCVPWFRLRSKFVPPKKLTEGGAEAGKKDKKKEKSNKETNSIPISTAALQAQSSGKHSPKKDKKEDDDSGSGSFDGDEVGNMPNFGGGGGGRQFNSGQSDVSASTTASQQMSAEMRLEFMKEVVVHYFLGVCVKLGEKVTKGNSSHGKLHQGYQVSLTAHFTAPSPAC